MTTVREIIKRDIGVKVEGVVKVFDRSALANEVREYVVTDKIEDELKRIVDTFTQVSETLRRGGASRDVVGMWVSGFFGSGKSHFAKVLGYLLQNDELGTDGERCIDAFVKHLSDSQRGKDVRLRLGEIKLNTQVRTIAFEIKSRQSLTNPNSVGEILLSEFYRDIGFGENFVVARIERRLHQRGLLDKLAETFESLHGVPWRSEQGREDLMTVRRRLSKVLPKIDPKEYPDEDSAKKALDDAFRHEKLTAEGIADELVAWVDAQKPTGGKSQHLVFVIDEMGTFIGDSNEKIGELNSLAEMIGNKGKGKVWLVVTSQQDLEKVVDRTNFQPTLVGRLNARFELKPHLISDEINKVVSERILKKRPAEESGLKAIYAKHEGHIADLADIKASRRLASVTERSFIDAYPFLPHQVRLAQDIFEALSGFRISGGVRSMIAVVMEALQDLADKPLGVVVSFDQVFDAVENDLLSQEYLGASGVRSIYESDERVPNMPVESSRVLKVLWLLQRITWVPRVPETLAKLLVRDLTTEIAPLRGQVEATLTSLQEAGYVARDEATGEWKFLNERERTIEQAIQEMVRPGGTKSISIAAVRRTAQQLCKDEVVTRKKLANFAVTHGTTKVPFSFGVHLDGEAVETGPELEVVFTSPLAPGRKTDLDEVRRQNQASGAKGKTVWWVADAPDNLESRFKRYEALVKVTGDKRFTEDSSSDTQDALSEKRKERDELRSALVKDLERAFVTGTLFHGGQEISLEGISDLKEPIKSALSSVIPNVYPRFAIADRSFEFAKNLKALLSPTTSELHKVAPDLQLFDTQGSLQRESALVAQVLEVLTDLRDEDADAEGARLLDAKDDKGFKGFSRAPFGWPDELVRLLLAACFRAGAVYLEQQTASGPSALYDYKGADEVFSKITSFKKATFRIAGDEPLGRPDQKGEQGAHRDGRDRHAGVRQRHRRCRADPRARAQVPHRRRAHSGAAGPARARDHPRCGERAHRAHHGQGPDGRGHRLPREGRRVEDAPPVRRGAAALPRREPAQGLRPVASAAGARDRPPAARSASEARAVRSGGEGPRGHRGRQGGRRALVGLPLRVRHGLCGRTAMRSCRATTRSGTRPRRPSPPSTPAMPTRTRPRASAKPSSPRCSARGGSVTIHRSRFRPWSHCSTPPASGA
jgi:hypothetical protein